MFLLIRKWFLINMRRASIVPVVLIWISWREVMISLIALRVVSFILIILNLLSWLKDFSTSSVYSLMIVKRPYIVMSKQWRRDVIFRLIVIIHCCWGIYWKRLSFLIIIEMRDSKILIIIISILVWINILSEWLFIYKCMRVRIIDWFFVLRVSLIMLRI